VLSQAEKEPGIGNLLSPLYRHTIWGAAWREAASSVRVTYTAQQKTKDMKP